MLISPPEAAQLAGERADYRRSQGGQVPEIQVSQEHYAVILRINIS